MSILIFTCSINIARLIADIPWIASLPVPTHFGIAGLPQRVIVSDAMRWASLTWGLGGSPWASNRAKVETEGKSVSENVSDEYQIRYQQAVARTRTEYKSKGVTFYGVTPCASQRRSVRHARRHTGHNEQLRQSERGCRVLPGVRKESKTLLVVVL